MISWGGFKFEVQQLTLNYTADSFLRRAMKPSKPKPANSMA